MIGKYMRGLRHLFHSVEDFTSQRILLLVQGRFHVGDVVRVGDRIYVYQNAIGDRSHANIFNDSKEEKQAHKLKDEIFSIASRSNRVFTCHNGGSSSMSPLLHYNASIILLPVDFQEMYDSFLSNNKKVFADIFKKYTNPQDNLCVYFYALSNGSPRLIAWALTNYFKNGVDVALLSNIIKWYNNYSQLVSKLNLKTITAYNRIDDILALDDEAIKLRSIKRSNDVINTFNTAQKKLLKSEELSPKEAIILGKFANLSRAKRTNFIQKMSSVEDRSEIFKQMSLISNIHFDWNAQSLIEYINNNEMIDCDIIISKDDLVLLKVKTFDSVKYLAKTTNWCISKNKSYWNNYIEHDTKSHQFILFDFSQKEDSELSIVGFTMMQGRGITHAHSFTNNSLMREVTTIEDTWAWEIPTQSIFSILDKHGIAYTNLLEKVTPRYEWNRSSTLNYLEQFVHKDYKILLDENNKLVLTIKSEGVSSFVGRGYEAMYDRGYSDSQKHIFFFDFNKSSNDMQRFVFGVVGQNGDTYEEYCNDLFDVNANTIGTSFDEMLMKYNLPYDTICRVDTSLNRFISALRIGKKGLIKELLAKLSRKDFKKLTHSQSNAIFSSINNSLVSFKTFASIDAIYDNGLTLKDILGSHLASCMLQDVANTLTNAFRHTRDRNIPTEDDINQFNNHTLDRGKIDKVGYYLTLMKLLDYETDDDVIASFLANILYIKDYCVELYKGILLYEMNKIDFTNEKSMATRSIIQVVSHAKMFDLFDDMLKRPYTHEVLSLILMCIPKGSAEYVKYSQQLSVCEA